jgi:hypothetical protein
MDYELLQMRIGRETEVDKLIGSGKIPLEQREHHIGLFDVDGEYLSERIKGVLGDAISHMAKPKMSTKRCEEYIRKRINSEFKGVGSLISILDDAAQRRAMLEMHRAESRTRSQNAFASLGAVVIATRLEASAPEEIRREVQGAGTQRLLNKIAHSAGTIASTTMVEGTKAVAFDAKDAVQELVSAEAAILEDAEADKALEKVLADQKFQTSSAKDKEKVEAQPKQTESMF